MSVKTLVLLGLLGAILLGGLGPLQPETAAASSHNPTRSLSASWVLPGGEVQVTVDASGFGGFGLLRETLPAGFTYAGSDQPEAAVSVEDRTVSFTLLGVERVTYTVMAPATPGQHVFSGVILDAQKEDEVVGGDSAIRVGPAPTPTPAPAATATPTPEPTATPTPRPTATPTTEATPTHTPTPGPTATPAPEPTATPTPAPTATSTPKPAATATVTSVPIVAPPDEGNGMPRWLLWLLLLIVVIALVAGSVSYAGRRR